MPRTKKPVRKEEKSVEDNEAMKKFLKFIVDEKNKVDAKCQMELKNIELSFKILVGSISPHYLNKTIGELKFELILKELPSSQASCSSMTGSHDDGYLTENSSQDSGQRDAKKFIPPPSASRTRGRRSRSADMSARSVKIVPRPTTTSRRRSRSVYKTPLYNKNASVAYPAITPKVTPHTPLTVLRQPRQGEMVVSMSGSPLAVPTCYTLDPDKKANCNILLQDGTMLSLQPHQLRQSQTFIPYSLMDSNLINQLKTIKDNLDKIVKVGQKSVK